MQQRGGLIRTQTQREKAVQIGALNTKMHAEKGVHHRERETVFSHKRVCPTTVHTNARGLMCTLTTRGLDDHTKRTSPRQLSVRLVPSSRCLLRFQSVGHAKPTPFIGSTTWPTTWPTSRARASVDLVLPSSFSLLLLSV